MTFPGPLEHIAMKAASAIEDEFAKGHVGGVAQRRNAVQGLVVAAIRQAFEDATHGLITTAAKG